MIICSICLTHTLGGPKIKLQHNHQQITLYHSKTCHILTAFVTIIYSVINRKKAKLGSRKESAHAALFKTHAQLVKLRVAATMNCRNSEQRVLQVQQSTAVSVDHHVPGVNVNWPYNTTQNLLATGDWLEFNGTFSTVRLYRAFRSYSLHFGKYKHPASLVHLLFSNGWPVT